MNADFIAEVGLSRRSVLTKDKGGGGGDVRGIFVPALINKTRPVSRWSTYYYYSTLLFVVIESSVDPSGKYNFHIANVN